MQNLSNRPILLWFPFDQLAHYLRSLELARQLKPYFDIRFAASAAYAPFIEKEGFATFPCRTLNAAYVTDCVRRFSFEWMNPAFLEHVLHDQVRVIQSVQPFAVVGDTSVTLKMAAEKGGVPYIALMNAYTSKYYGITRTLPQRHPLYKVLHFLPESILHPMIEKGELMTYQKIHKPFAALRQRYGLSPMQSFADETEGDLNLITDLEHLFPLKPLPDHYLHIPPLFYTGGNAEGRFTVKDGRRTIFVSMGSSGSWNDVRFLNHPFFHGYNIITAGDRQGVVSGPHVQAADFVDAASLFPHVDLVICHGGNGTIYQALSYGIPLLCRTTHFEQEWNVQALQKAGLGQSLDGIRNTEDLAAVIHSWMQIKGTTALRSVRDEINRNVQQLPSVALQLASIINDMKGEDQRMTA